MAAILQELDGSLCLAPESQKSHTRLKARASATGGLLMSRADTSLLASPDGAIQLAYVGTASVHPWRGPDRGDPVEAFLADEKRCTADCCTSGTHWAVAEFKTATVDNVEALYRAHLEVPAEFA